MTFIGKSEVGRSGADTNVVVPVRLAAAVQVELDARVVALVSAGELDPLRHLFAVTTNVKVETVDVKLRATPLRRHVGSGIAMQRQQFGAQDVHAGLDVAGQLECVGRVAVDQVLVGPLAYALVSISCEFKRLTYARLVIASLGDLEKLNLGGLLRRAVPRAEILASRKPRPFPCVGNLR